MVSNDRYLNVVEENHYLKEQIKNSDAACTKMMAEMMKMSSEMDKLSAELKETRKVVTNTQSILKNLDRERLKIVYQKKELAAKFAKAQEFIAGYDDEDKCCECCWTNGDEIGCLCPDGCKWTPVI